MRSKTSDNERHLFIIWEKGRFVEADIIKDLDSHFSIIHSFVMCWSPQMVHDNFSRFYGQNLPSNSFKEVECGRGAFRIVIVEDQNPIYAERLTSGGTRLVNINIFDAKQKYRKWTGGGHKIHGTDNPKEAAEQILMIAGSDDVSEILVDDHPVKSPVIYRDLVGSCGWRSANEFFNFMNRSVEYCVLRSNLEEVYEVLDTGIGDIDFLTPCRRTFWYRAGVPSAAIHNDCSCRVMIGGTSIIIDVSEVGDGELNERLQKSILENKMQSQNIYFADPLSDLRGVLFRGISTKLDFDLYGNQDLRYLNKIALEEESLFQKLNLVPSGENLRVILNEMIQAGYHKTNLPTNLDSRYHPRAIYINASNFQYQTWRAMRFIRKLICIRKNGQSAEILILRRAKNYFTFKLKVRNRLNLTIKIGSIH